MDYEDKIIYDSTLVNFPCQKNIIKGIYDNNSILSNYILDIFDSSKSLNLTLKNSTVLPDNISATTGDNPSLINCSNQSCNVDIFYNQNFLNEATDLAIAVVTLHESIHALFLTLTLDNELGITGYNINLDYASLLKVYFAYVNNNDGSNYGTVHHAELTEFIDSISDSLQIYGQSKGYNLDSDFYDRLAWFGLDDTLEFETFYPEFVDHDNDSTTVSAMSSCVV